MFTGLPIVQTEVFSRLPDEFRINEASDWSRIRGGPPLDSFLEGPAFDAEGNLFCVDIPHGRIFKVSPAGQWSLFTKYDGRPNGLKIDKSGRIFVADAVKGILSFDPVTAERKVVLDTFEGKPLGGVNDLTLADNGDIYFTDPAGSDFRNRHGRVFRIKASGKAEMLLGDLPLPNGLVLNPEQDTLYIALTRTLQVLRLSLHPDIVGAHKCGVFVQLSGGLAGPDGMTVDAAGNLLVAHSGFATVWQFDKIGEPLCRIRSCAGIRTTNVAYGGADRKTLYITESETGSILTCRMPTPGR